MGLVLWPNQESNLKVSNEFGVWVTKTWTYGSKSKGLICKTLILFEKTEVIFVLYAVVALVAAIVAVWQFYSYISQNVPKGSESSLGLIVGIVCGIVAIICFGLFLSGKVNKSEEIHITE